MLRHRHAMVEVAQQPRPAQRRRAVAGARAFLGRRDKRYPHRMNAKSPLPSRSPFDRLRVRTQSKRLPHAEPVAASACLTTMPSFSETVPTNTTLPAEALVRVLREERAQTGRGRGRERGGRTEIIGVV